MKYLLDRSTIAHRLNAKFWNGLLQFIKYSFTGFINLGISSILFLLLYKLFQINYLVVFVSTWLFGIFITYTINLVWVFKPEEKREFFSRLPRYFTVYFISFIINLVLLKRIVGYYHFDAFWGQMLILPLVVVINFLGFKHWAMK